MTHVHPTAVVDPDAQLDPSVEVGPFCVIEAGVAIAANTTLGPYVHIQGLTDIGPNNRIGTGCTLGHAPQHLGYAGEPRRLRIGADNTIREYVSIHRAFAADAATTIGDGCFIMGFAHIGHDSVVHDGATISNGALIAGHVHIGAGAIISGPVGVHQFCRIGRLAMVAGMSRINQDVPPFTIVPGTPAFVRGLNSVGLRRRRLGRQTRDELKQVFKQLYRADAPLKEAFEHLDVDNLGPEARELATFHQDSQRGVTPHARYRHVDGEG